MMTLRIAKRPPDALFTLAVDRWTAPFWEQAAAGRLSAPRCAVCGRFRMPPTPYCPNCRSQKIDWEELSGRGSLYSYTIVERATLAGTGDCIPYVPAVVTLEGAGGLRLVSNVVDTPIDDLAVGMALAVVFDRLNENVTVPRFRGERMRA